MERSIYRGLPPPRDERPRVYDIVAPEPGATLDVTVLDYGFICGMGHWSQHPVTKRYSTTLCFAPDQCEGCAAKERQVWIGFIGIYNHREHARQILRVGGETAGKLESFAVRLFGLQGQRFELSRPNNRKTQALGIRHADSPPLKPLPEPHPVIPTLRILFSVDRLPWLSDDGALDKEGEG